MDCRRRRRDRSSIYARPSGKHEGLGFSASLFAVYFCRTRLSMRTSDNCANLSLTTKSVSFPTRRRSRAVRRLAHFRSRARCARPSPCTRDPRAIHSNWWTRAEATPRPRAAGSTPKPSSESRVPAIRYRTTPTTCRSISATRARRSMTAIFVRCRSAASVGRYTFRRSTVARRSTSAARGSSSGLSSWTSTPLPPLPFAFLLSTFYFLLS